jgi:hypothetical protein
MIFSGLGGLKIGGTSSLMDREPKYGKGNQIMCHDQTLRGPTWPGPRLYSGVQNWVSV